MPQRERCDSGSIFANFTSAGIIPFAYDGSLLIFLMVPDLQGLPKGFPRFSDYGGPRVPEDIHASVTAARCFITQYGAEESPQAYRRLAAEMRLRGKSPAVQCFYNADARHIVFFVEMTNQLAPKVRSMWIPYSQMIANLSILGFACGRLCFGPEDVKHMKRWMQQVNQRVRAD
eukprot:RCo022159